MIHEIVLDIAVYSKLLNYYLTEIGVSRALGSNFHNEMMKYFANQFHIIYMGGDDMSNLTFEREEDILFFKLKVL